MKKEKKEEKAKALHGAADRCLRILLEEARPDLGAVAEKTGRPLAEAQAMMDGPTQLADWFTLWVICLEEYESDRDKLAATIRILADRDELDGGMVSFLTAVARLVQVELELSPQDNAGESDAELR